MSGIWDAADMLTAMAGDADAAAALARGLAEDCATERDSGEGAYWQSVALALDERANPRPSIAAPPATVVDVAPIASILHRGPSAPAPTPAAPTPAASGAVVHRLDFGTRRPVAPRTPGPEQAYHRNFERHPASLRRMTPEPNGAA